MLSVFFCGGAPGGARFQRVKVPNPPGSGKDIAESNGVHREVESEGSWIWETNEPTDTPFIQPDMEGKRQCRAGYP